MPKLLPINGQAKQAGIADPFNDDLPLPANAVDGQATPAGLREALANRKAAFDYSRYSVDNVRCEGMVVPLDSLVQDPMNARLHPEQNLEAIMQSFAASGQMKPLVVREQNRVIAAGNGSALAMRRLGWTKCAVSVVPMTDVEFYTYALADNRTAELAQQDVEVTAKIEELLRLGGGHMIGWSSQDIAIMRAKTKNANAEPDDIPVVPKIPLTCKGDIWLLGQHRLMCGDSASEVDVTRLIRDSVGRLMATDPPYGVRFGEANHNPRAKDWAAIEGDTCAGSDLRQWFVSVLRVWQRHMKKDSAFYIWSAQLKEGHRLYEAIEDTGLHVQGQVVWVKNVFALGQADYQWCHELCWYAFWKGENHRWYGDRDKRTTWEVKKIANSTYLHPAQKPTELYERPIEHHTTGDDIIFEPFTGSGTQFIAAERLGRICYGMEIDPVYCDVTLSRWAAYTGDDPVRESDGAKWSEVSKRGPAVAGPQ
jgi:DNA modification methylase